MPFTHQRPTPTPQATLPPRSPLRNHSFNLAQTAHLAHTTRRKLSTAASRADHDLRVLVGHANFLDSLLLELASAHRDQEYDPSPSPTMESFALQRVEEPKRRANGADLAVSEKPVQVDEWEVWESESDGSESDGSDSDSGDERGENIGAVTSTKGWVMRPGLARAGKVAVVAREVGEDEDDDKDDYGDLGLVRTLSHSPPRFLGDPFA